MPQLTHAAPGFLFEFGANALFRAGVVEQPSRGLDQEAVMAVDIGRKAKLARQQYRAALQVVQKRGGAVAAVVGFARQRLPFPVPPADVEGGFLEQIPIVR